MKPWSDARTFEELCQVNIRFLRGELDESPNHGGPPGPETREIQNALIELNRRGFLTTCSQLGADEGPYDRQRAFVTGFASDSVVADMAARELYSDLIVLRFQPMVDALAEPDNQGSPFRITVTVDEGYIFTALGDPDWEELVRYAEACPHIRAELSRMWSVQIVDPQWGRKNYLWETVLQAAGEGHVAKWRFAKEG